MCRYAGKRYKVHFVCFDCRKSFKKPPIEDYAMQNGDWEHYKIVFWNIHSGVRKKFVKEHPERVRELNHKYQHRIEKCPDCGNEMMDLGLDFKAPKKHKLRNGRLLKGCTTLVLIFILVVAMGSDISLKNLISIWIT